MTMIRTKSDLRDHAFSRVDMIKTWDGFYHTDRSEILSVAEQAVSLIVKREKLNKCCPGTKYFIELTNDIADTCYKPSTNDQDNKSIAADIIALICIENQISKSKDDLYISSLLFDLSLVGSSLDVLTYQEEIDAILNSMATFLTVTDEKKATEFLEDLSSSVVRFVMRRRKIEIKGTNLNHHYRIAECTIFITFKMKSPWLAYEMECLNKNRAREAERNKYKF